MKLPHLVTVLGVAALVRFVRDVKRAAALERIRQKQADDEYTEWYDNAERMR